MMLSLDPGVKIFKNLHTFFRSLTRSVTWMIRHDEEEQRGAVHKLYQLKVSVG